MATKEKLQLCKEIVSKLENDEMTMIHGGYDESVWGENGLVCETQPPKTCLVPIEPK